ncbi:MAG: PHP N-terminal domain protein [uncultured Campylobacterales bacterium]|uniref:PHP N-terminal domain protein n=1 Tax=uncultured Campylobacterales bacterium TaxID=352960 RepID=A0A6S6SE86_9BACT|nr:MAG: PHP N-terminal domain protein [uncultured Campylobacterales bacterium]
MNDKFINGSQWVRFDCHLHTDSDNEFKYNEDKNYYISSYVNKLKEKNISVGVITNHNKFNLEEFKAIKKTANKKDIFVMPGVELSVNDGANGIHTLIVFDEKEWLEDGNNYIQQFIDESFVTQNPNNYQNENGRSNDNLITTIKKLNDYHRGYFIILAHVEDKSGFFNALEGGRVTEFGKNKLFRDSVIGFQKVRTRDNIIKWNKWLDNNLPAFVEGSDPKKIEEIGKGKKSYIKIGDYNFEAVKFALQDNKYRVSKETQNRENSFIKSIAFDGGKLNGQIIELSSSMNNLVGVRGSGKSSIIEAVRYGLDLPFGSNSVDIDYKNNLVKELLGSAGKISIKAIDKDDREYLIERVYGHSLEIKKDGELKNVGILSILNKPLYFGQKDLSSYKSGFEGDLINKLIGDKTKDIQVSIDVKKQEVKSLLENIKKYDNLDDKKEEITRKIAELNLKIDEFKKHKIEEKLQKQIEFNKDKTSLQSIKKRLKEFRSDVDEFLSQYEKENFFEKMKNYESKENQDTFDEIYKIVDETEKSFIDITAGLHKLINSFKNINGIENDFNTKAKELEVEFLEIQREISIPNLRADDFMTYTKSLHTQKMMLAELEKSGAIKKDMNSKLVKLLSELNDLYREEFKIIEVEINKINSTQKFIKLKSEFKGDKSSFEQYLKNIFGGSGLGKADYEKLCTYVDCSEVYNDFENISFGGNKLLVFRERFMNSLSSLLTFKVPNKIEIFYNGKELTKHSLGQRSSALIIFILTQQDNDIIVIDQPEDDLDNQTIYNEVIKELVKLKNKTQFIFATHNANIPVLGDCEQIVVCDYDENKINTELGSIDNHDIQEKIINIMEGGEEAFDKRREIYNLWKH